MSIATGNISVPENDVDWCPGEHLTLIGNERQAPPVARVLFAHKADNGPRAIFDTPDDVAINIIGLGGEPAYQVEGTALAEALYGTLPAVTVAALMKRLGELSEGKGKEA